MFVVQFNTKIKEPERCFMCKDKSLASDFWFKNSIEMSLSDVSDIYNWELNLWAPWNISK